jgi:hypothetical protein
MAHRKAEQQRRPDDRAALEDARAELEWQLSQATTEDERLDVMDQLRRLDRMNERVGHPRRQE